MAREKRQYAFRIYKNGNPYLEYRYYTLKHIYEKTTLYENKEQLKDEIRKRLGIESSNIDVELVFYFNRKTGKIYNVPILYQDDRLILDKKYLDRKFDEFLNKPYMINGANFIESFLQLFMPGGECSTPGLSEAVNSAYDGYKNRGNYIINLKKIYERTSNMKTRLRVYYLIKDYVVEQDKKRKENERIVASAFQREEQKVRDRVKELKSRADV